MMVAAKYEEGWGPSINEFVLSTNNSFIKDDILNNDVNADNYETRTRMLGTFLVEMTLLDWRFLQCKPSLIAAMGMYSARQMLGRDWNALFTHHSGFVAENLEPGYWWICEKLTEENFVCNIRKDSATGHVTGAMNINSHYY
ncbi:hypothetical protein BDR06DRAFT_977852 [Suillus hirtellus]|nr:hypothetical protein BDR06DRAFT_977852 [Suillus hirtellus]